MKRSRLPSVLTCLAVVLAALLASCGSSDAIFYTLESERELVDDRGIPDDANVFRVVSTGTRFFAAGARVYWRGTGPTDQWQTIPPPAGISGAICNQIEYFAASGDIVAWFFNTNNVYDNGLYRLDPSNVAGGWYAQVTLPGTPDRLTLLKRDPQTASTQLLVGSTDGAVYSLFTLSSAYALLATDSLSEEALDIAHDGTTYWLVTVVSSANPAPPPDTLYLYRAAALGLLGEVDDGSAPALTAPGGLYADGTRVYLSSKEGTIFFHDGAAPNAWSTWSGDPIEVDSSAVAFTGFVAADGTNLFVGTAAHGYYQFSPAAGSSEVSSYQASDFTRGPSYNIGDLYNGAVLSFLAVDDAGPYDPDTLFACTYGNGLWRADYDPIASEVWPWVQE